MRPVSLIPYGTFLPVITHQCPHPLARVTRPSSPRVDVSHGRMTTA